MRSFFPTLLSLFFFTLAASGQSGPEAVYLTRNTSLDISVAGNSLSINESHVSEKQFIRNFEKHARESVYFSDFDPITSLEAQTIPLSGRKTKVSTIETEDIFQSGVFYGGYKRRNFVFPTITTGAVGRLEYAKQITDAHFVLPFYFDDDIPVVSSVYSVTIPPNVKIGYKIFGNQSDKIIKTEKVVGGKITHTWSLTNVPPFRREEDAPSRSYSAPHIIVYIQSFESRDGRLQQVTADVSDLYQWYESMIQRIPRNSSEDGLRQLVAEVTKGMTNDHDKARAIFQWTQDHIKYIAFEDGMAGFIPRSSSDVYVKRYGDCKDMANFLKDLLTIGGIEARHAWIGTRSRPYIYSEVPTAITDNHMICAVTTKDGYLFLDATDSFVSFGSPSSMIQNKEALVGIGSGKFEVVKVPVVDRRVNRRNDSIRISLEGEAVKGAFRSSLSGFRKVDFERKHLKAELDNDREFVRDFFTVGKNNITMDHIAMKGLGDQNLPAITSFDFLQPAYLKRIGDKVYVNLHLNRSNPGEKLDIALREQALEADYCYEDLSVTEFMVPEGYAPSFIPPDTKKEWKNFAISVSYRAEGERVVMEKRIFSDFLYLEKSKFQEWNDFIDAVATIQQQSMTLTKK